MTVTSRRRIQQTLKRRRLLDAARALIAANGVPGLRIQEITEGADVALGSFYNYFQSKDELLSTIVTETLSQLGSLTVLGAADDADPAELVALGALRVIGLPKREPNLARLIINIARSESVFLDAIQPFARAAAERGIACGQFVVVELDVLLTILIGGAFALMRDILNGRHSESAELQFAVYALTSFGVQASEAALVVEHVAQSFCG